MEETVKKKIVLVVDFDNTLINIDVFKLKLSKLVLYSPFKLLKLLIDYSGWVNFKLQVLESKLPNELQFKDCVNLELLTYIISIKENFTKVVIVSATPLNFLLNFIPDSLFDEIHGSTNINLKGRSKLEYIKRNFGCNFGYIGDSNADNCIFYDSIYAVKVSSRKFQILKNEIF